MFKLNLSGAPVSSETRAANVLLNRELKQVLARKAAEKKASNNKSA